MKKINSYLLGLIIVSFSFQSCKKDDIDPNSNSDTSLETPNLTSPLHIYGTINDTLRVFEHQKNGIIIASGELSGSSEDGYDSELECAFESSFFSTDIYRKFSVSFFNVYDSKWDAPEHNQRVKVGTQNYGIKNDIDEIYTPGVIVTFLDVNGIYWKSDYGSASQIESDFEVTKFLDSPSFAQYHEFEASFSCTLYNDSGDSKKLKNGFVKGLIATFDD